MGNNIGLESRSGLSEQLAAPRAFDYFDGDDNGSSVFNRYLLSHLSMKIYNNGVGFNQFEQNLQNFYGNHGVEDVQAFRDVSTGADGAIFVTSDAVIVVFRGTSPGESAGPLADHFADIDFAVELIKVNNREIGVHRGFWQAASSVYQEIRARVAAEVADGKKLWLTGHSLGGATAAVTAFRFHYLGGIPVQGLMTFGAPRVGDADFYKAAELAVGGAPSLISRTQRFVLDGDPAPTFWNVGTDYRGHDHAYHHFGITHTIDKTNNGSFTFDYNSGDLPMDPIPLSEIYGRLSTGIHMEYEWAMFPEIAAYLQQTGQQAAFNAIDALPLD